ncbi:putative kelch motif domain-containing protein [Neospora caninum Liverpool]|uniref:Kelch motif domain-containing protein, putative n=1 Tax=Neospora caninum (strain Liverpool) TaxID=572307 RepID=F0VGB6_NEOCL|nr:putative kelch motif domain-containing protein [Neospora caninum Liverpool]CBZ52760.1 putative kelch motif domain-containing protein [Neospora caninum Liverpool]CEL66742.1 TPA: kelch motif domain-containing protein, putative [Neospora caninum Liverpool]|eukprot:XP_003882792.1 putative kelch motif domain-containing protein [Neospora caninum Liverpool]
MRSEAGSRSSVPSPESSASCASLSSFEKEVSPLPPSNLLSGFDRANPKNAAAGALRYLAGSGPAGVSAESGAGRAEPTAVGSLPRGLGRKLLPGVASAGTTLSGGSSVSHFFPTYPEASYSPPPAMNPTGRVSTSGAGSVPRRGSADDAIVYSVPTPPALPSRSTLEPALGAVGGVTAPFSAAPEFLYSAAGARGLAGGTGVSYLSGGERSFANGRVTRPSLPFSETSVLAASHRPGLASDPEPLASHKFLTPLAAPQRDANPQFNGDGVDESPLANGDEDASAGAFASAEDFETMVGDLRRTFIGWLKKTESDLRKEKRDLLRAKKEFEEERKQARERLQQEKKFEYDKIKEERRKAQAEIATQIKQIQVEREDARRKLNAERGRFEEEKEVHRRRTLLEKERFRQEAEALDAEKRRIVDTNIATETVVDLNVGGVIFEASRHTFVQQPGSFLETLLSGRHHVSRDKQGRIFLDRDSELFRIILNFLRNPSMPPQPRDSAESDAITQEAEFLGIRFFPFPLVFAVGGHNGVEHLRSLEVLDIGQQCWRPCKAMQTERAYFGNSVFQNRLFVYGGQNLDYKALCETEVFDCLRDVWTTAAPLNIPRRNTCGTFMNNRHFAIGGFDGSDILSSVECYDPRMKNWMEVAALSTPRSSAMCCVQEDHLYVLGGTNGERLRTVEVYDHRMNKWEVLPSEMIEVRSAGSAACSLGHIVVMGGIDNTNVVHNSVEVLDPQTQRWSFLANMETPRMDCAAVVVSDSILVTGGQSEDVLSSTAFLRQEVNEWQEGPPMISPRYGHGMLLANL